MSTKWGRIFCLPCQREGDHEVVVGFFYIDMNPSVIALRSAATSL